MDILSLTQNAFQNYWFLLLVLAYFGYRSYKIHLVKKMLPTLKERGAQIIDVRTQDEFRAGNNPQTLNIPLDALKKQMNKIRKTVPVVVCCASGSRSGMAMRILKSQGLEVYNAGKWQNTL